MPKVQAIVNIANTDYPLKTRHFTNLWLFRNLLQACLFVILRKLRISCPWGDSKFPKNDTYPKGAEQGKMMRFRSRKILFGNKFRQEPLVGLPVLVFWSFTTHLGYIRHSNPHRTVSPPRFAGDGAHFAFVFIRKVSVV